MKIWAPLIWFISIVALFGNDLFNLRLLFALPLVLLLIFHLSLAVVQVRDGVVQYRRLFKWIPIESAELVSSGLIWPPFVGYIQLNRSLFPWRKLYFVLDRNMQSNPFRRGDYAILRFLKEHEASSDSDELPRSGTIRKSVVHIKLAAAVLAGVIISLLRFHFVTSPALGEYTRPESPLVSGPVTFFRMLNHAEVAIILAVGLLFMSAYTRHRPGGWTFAFLTGLCLPFVFIR